jgi:hypothetical protein
MNLKHFLIQKLALLLLLASCAQLSQHDPTTEATSPKSQESNLLSIRGRTALTEIQLQNHLEPMGIATNSWINGIFTVYVTQSQYEWLKTQEWVNSLESAGTAKLK